MPRGPKGEKRPADVIGAAVMVLALYFVWYNFARTHKAHKLSPAMAAGITDKLWDVADIVKLIGDYEAHRNTKAA